MRKANPSESLSRVGVSPPSQRLRPGRNPYPALALRDIAVKLDWRPATGCSEDG